MLSDRDYMSQRPRWQQGQHQGPSIVTLLIWANVVVFGLQYLVNIDTVLWLSAPEFRRLELWRLGTYMFCHGSFWHIFMNMWGLHMFGRPLEERLGGTRFVHLYLVSGAIGGLTWLLFNWNSMYPVLGASGALFGVMMAAAMMFPNQQIMLLLPPIPMKLKTFVAVYAGLEIFFELTSLEAGVAHLAHLGGLLGGFLYMRNAMGRPILDEVGQRLRNLFRRRPRGPEPRPFDPTVGGTSEPAGDGAEFLREVDRVLDKIGRDGLNSLTPDERRVLERARDRLKNR